jgi:hypothetical protein
MPFDTGSPQFGLNDGKIATWVSGSTYTPAGGTDIMSIQMGSVAMEVITSTLTGDDKQTAVASNAIGGTLQLRWGGLNLSMLAILLGKVAASSSSQSNVQITGGQKMPYVGIILKALSAETGDTWIFIPKCKIASTFTLVQMEYGTFAIPEVTMQIVDDDKWGSINVLTHPVDTPITAFPPTLITPLP